MSQRVFLLRFFLSTFSSLFSSFVTTSQQLHSVASHLSSLHCNSSSSNSSHSGLITALTRILSSVSFPPSCITTFLSTFPPRKPSSSNKPLFHLPPFSLILFFPSLSLLSFLLRFFPSFLSPYITFLFPLSFARRPPPQTSHRTISFLLSLSSSFPLSFSSSYINFLFPLFFPRRPSFSNKILHYCPPLSLIFNFLSLSVLFFLLWADSTILPELPYQTVLSKFVRHERDLQYEISKLLTS